MIDYWYIFNYMTKIEGVNAGAIFLTNGQILYVSPNFWVRSLLVYSLTLLSNVHCVYIRSVCANTLLKQAIQRQNICVYRAALSAAGGAASRQTS